MRTQRNRHRVEKHAFRNVDKKNSRELLYASLLELFMPDLVYKSSWSTKLITTYPSYASCIFNSPIFLQLAHKIFEWLKGRDYGHSIRNLLENSLCFKYKSPVCLFKRKLSHFLYCNKYLCRIYQYKTVWNCPSFLLQHQT